MRILGLVFSAAILIPFILVESVSARTVRPDGRRTSLYPTEIFPSSTSRISNASSTSPPTSTSGRDIQAPHSPEEAAVWTQATWIQMFRKLMEMDSEIRRQEALLSELQNQHLQKPIWRSLKTLVAQMMIGSGAVLPAAIVGLEQLSIIRHGNSFSSLIVAGTLSVLAGASLTIREFMSEERLNVGRGLPIQPLLMALEERARNWKLAEAKLAAPLAEWLPEMVEELRQLEVDRLSVMAWYLHRSEEQFQARELAGKKGEAESQSTLRWISELEVTRDFFRALREIVGVELILVTRVQIGLSREGSVVTEESSRSAVSLCRNVMQTLYLRKIM